MGLLYRRRPIRRLNPAVALSPDGGTVATVLNEFKIFGTTYPDDRQVLLSIDAASGSTTELAAVPWKMVPVSTVQFSRDATAVHTLLDSGPDPQFPLFANTQSGVFRYEVSTAQLTKLIGVPAFFGVAADGRLALGGGATEEAGIVAEGGNPHLWGKLFLLDPSRGGFLWLRRGRLMQHTNGRDQFSLRGKLLQPASAPLNPAVEDVSVTLLGSNGQLFRATLPAGTMRIRSGRWIYSNPRASDLTKLSLKATDASHYDFAASGHRLGLFATTTPYVTVEIQAGPAVFSNAQLFRRTRARLVYP